MSRPSQAALVALALFAAAALGFSEAAVGKGLVVGKKQRLAHCKTGTAHAAGKRWACDSPAKVTPRDQADRGASRAGRMLTGLPLRAKKHGGRVGAKLKRLRSRAFSKPLLKTLVRARPLVERRAGGGGATAPARHRAGAVASGGGSSETISFSKEGARVSGHVERAEAAADQVGAATELGVEVAKELDGVTLTVGEEAEEKSAVSACPDAGGTVPGKVSRLWALTLRAEEPKAANVRARVETRIRGTLQGHVGEDGVLRDYDVDLDFRIHAQAAVRGEGGRLLATTPPELFTWHVVGTGLEVGKQASLPVTAGRGTGGSVHTYGGTTYYQGEAAKDSLNLAWIQSIILQKRLEDLLEEAQRGWQGGKCLKVDVAASPPRLAAGEHGLVTVNVTPQGGAKGLAPGALSATASTGAITPADSSFGTVTLPLSYAAPATEKWGSAEVRVKVVSRQGSAEGSAAIAEEPKPPSDHYFRVVAIDGTYDMQYVSHRSSPPCTVTGSEHSTMGLAAEAEREATDGHVSERYGTVWLPTAVAGSQDYSSSPCDDSAGHAANPCHGTIANVRLWLDALSVEHEPGAASATVTLTAPGTIPYVAPMCPQWFHDGGEIYWRDHPTMTASVPWSTLTGSQPFTISVADSWDYEPAHTVARTRSVTLQPVDEQGRPL